MLSVKLVKKKKKNSGQVLKWYPVVGDTVENEERERKDEKVVTFYYIDKVS